MEEITKETYVEHTLPIVINYLWSYPRLSFQQDGGPGHTAESTMAYLASWNIIPVFHCPFSPDLSPIEALWDRMKDILQTLHP